MSKAVIVMGKHGARSVDSSSQMLKRLYLVEREMMRMLGGYLLNIADWEIKKIIPHHIWQDSLRSNLLRERILEMRYPRRDVDKEHDSQLKLFLSLLIRCENDAEFIEVVCMMKQMLIVAYEEYVQDADSLDDAPSLEIIRNFIPQIKEQLRSIQPKYNGLVQNEVSDKSWWKDLDEALQEIGGLLGINGKSKTDTLQAVVGKRAEYVPPSVPKRDPSFLPAQYSSPPRQANSFIEEQIWIAIDQVNEIWAAEIAGLVLWTWSDMPWEFYLDLARWCYDETRHCIMGERRLQAWRFETGKDFPVYAEHYASQTGFGELAILALLHRFEIDGPGWKSGLKETFEEAGDTASSADFDYDWADESIHLMYGHKWVLHRVGGDMDAMEKLKDEVWKRWNDWFAEMCQRWDYEPFMSRILAKIEKIEAEHHV